MHELGGSFSAGAGGPHLRRLRALDQLWPAEQLSAWACRPAETFAPAVVDTAGPQTPLVEETDSSATSAVSAPGSPLDDEGGGQSSTRDVGRQASA